MLPGEEIVLQVRQHWVPAGLWWRLPGGLVAIAAGNATVVLPSTRDLPPLALLVAMLLGVLGFVILALAPYLRWYWRRYTLTTRRLIVEEGVFHRRERSIPLDRIQDVTLGLPLLGRLLGYGDVIVENAADSGASDTLQAIPHPRRFQEALLSLTRAA
jgi:putative membrane protein